MATFVGTGKDFGREASNLKHVTEHLEDPETKEPDESSGNDSKNKTPRFKCMEAHKQHFDKMDSPEAGKKVAFLNLETVHTNDENELEATTNCAKMSGEEDPIASIKNIKGVTHNFRDQRHATGSSWHACKQLFSCVQHKDKDIKDHHD